MSKNTLLVMIAVCIAACTTAPQTTTPIAKPPEPQANATAPAAQLATANPTANAKSSVPPGFKVKSVNGETVYCTRTTTLGSRFVKEICMNDAEMADFKLRNEQMRQDLRKNSSLCSGGTGYGNCPGNNG
jgi:hypothetical protein